MVSFEHLGVPVLQLSQLLNGSGSAVIAVVGERRVLCIVVGVHCALRIETAVEFATYLLLDVKSHVKKIFSTHISLQSMTASLKADFSLSLAIVALVLAVATTEEHAVVVERKLLEP